MRAKQIIRRAIAATPLALFPVRVRHGLAKGARWTLFPFSSYWRLGSVEGDVEAGLAWLHQIEGAVFWDIGAHYGIHAVGVAMSVGQSGQVVAFEPEPSAFRRLTTHVKNNFLEQVVLINAAVSDRPGTAFLTTRHSASTSDSRLVDSPQTNGVNHPINTVVPDELVSTSTIRLPNLIKIDVEGHGAKVIQGCLRSIAQSSPVIVLSLHSEDEKRGAIQALKPLGYRLFEPSGNEIQPDDYTSVIVFTVQ